MNDLAFYNTLKQQNDRRAHLIFFMGMICATQSEAEKLGFGEISDRLMQLAIEARYAVHDELLSMSVTGMLNS